MHAQGGWRMLWRGTQPTVIRLGLGAGLHFLILETIKPLFERRQSDGTHGMSAVGAMVTGELCMVDDSESGMGTCLGPAATGHRPPTTLRRPSLPAGGLSRTLAAVAACPFTIVKTRMEYSGAGALCNGGLQMAAAAAAAMR